jgi:SAM-dependent methyltransferase
MGDIESVITDLKKRPSGEEAKNLLRIRMKAALERLEADKMTHRMIHAATYCNDQLFGKSVLDVGCYTGYLYHWLGKPKNYTGIDTWPEAIEVAKEFAPEGDFRVADVRMFEGKYDVVWASQVLWSKTIGIQNAVEAAKKLAKTLVFVLASDDYDRREWRLHKELGTPGDAVNELYVVTMESNDQRLSV